MIWNANGKMNSASISDYKEIKFHVILTRLEDPSLEISFYGCASLFLMRIMEAKSGGCVGE